MTENSQPEPTLSKRRRHLRLGGFLVVLLLVPVLFLSQVVEVLLPWYLQRQGVEMDMSGAEVDLLERRIRLSDVRIGRRNGLALRFEQLGARVNIGALLAGELPLEDVQLHGGELDVQALQQARLGGDGEAGAAPLMIPEILIRDIRLKRIGKTLGREVVIKRLYLKGLEMPPRDAGEAALSTQGLRSRIEMLISAGAASLDLRGELVARGEILSADVRLQVEKLELAGLPKLAAPDQRLRLGGLLSADTAVTLRYDPNDERIESRLSGTLEASGFEFRDPRLRLAASAGYEGQLAVDWLLNSEQPRLEAQGQLSLTALDLEVGSETGSGDSVKGDGLRYQGTLVLDEDLQVVGKLDAAKVDLRMLPGPRNVSARDLSLGVDYNSAGARGSQALLTALRAADLQVNLEEQPPVRVAGHGLSADRLAFAPEARVELDGFSAAALETTGAAAMGTIRFADAKLGQLRTDAQGSVSLESARVRSLDIVNADYPLQLQSLVLEGLQRGAGESLAIRQLSAETLELRYKDQLLKAGSVSLARLRQAADQRFSAAALEVGSLDSRIGITAEASGLRAANVDLDTRTGIDSAKLSARRLSLAPGEDLGTLIEGRAQDLHYEFAGKLGFSELRAEQFDYQQRAGAWASIQSPLLEKLQVDINNGSYQAARLRAAALKAEQSRPAARLATGAVDLTAPQLDATLNARFDGLEVQALKLGAAEPPEWTVAVVSAGALRLGDAEGLSLESLELTDPVIDLVLDSAGQLNLPRLPFAAADGNPRTAPLAIRIARLSTTGKPSFSYTDRQVQPDYHLKVKPFSLQLQGFDSRPNTPPGEYRLLAQTGKFTHVDLSGKTQGTRDGVNLTVTGKLTGLELKNLSPYTGTYEKFAIRNGSGDLSVSGAVSGGVLDLQTYVVISKLEVEPFYQGRGANPEAEDGSGSLATALALLSDKNQTVKLKVPVSGPLDQPKFDFSDATGQAVAGLAKGAVMLAFQPLGILVSAAKFAGSLGTMAVEPVEFAPGEAKLVAESITLLDSLAAKLKGLEKLKLRICPRVVKADRGALAKKKLPALNDALRDLSQSRSRVVRDYLEQKQLVAARQLNTACKTPADDADDAKPRVELNLDTSALGKNVKAKPQAAPAN